jgi:hypothetical protein
VALAPDFASRPNPSPPPPPPSPPPEPDDLGLLVGLRGKWTGKGFNAMWRPYALGSGHDRFLELKLTDETLQFTRIQGAIPNRGLPQPDIRMGVLTYLQRISDANLAPPGNGLHTESGVWLNVPARMDPAVSASVTRLASIPHGMTILAQGVASEAAGPPSIPSISLNPFTIGDPSGASPFPEQNLGTATNVRTSGQGLTGIIQSMLANPNGVLEQASQGQTIISTVTLQVSSIDPPVEGGGTTGSAFVAGGASVPNANTAVVTATFWLETVQGSPNFHQLQYSQTVLLNFDGLSWPRVTVATLRLSAS